MEFNFNWEQVALIVVVCGFFWSLSYRMKELSNAVQSLQKAIEEGESRGTKEHEALMAKFESSTSDLHKHMREDTRDHTNAHKDLGEKMARALAIQEKG